VIKTATLTAFISVMATAIPAMVWIGSLQEKVRQLEHEVTTCASKEMQQSHDSWIKSWGEDVNYRLRRLEERR
jgi:Flp pilus assembly protein TadB